MERFFWNQKRYHSLDYHLKHTFGKKLYKISLNGNMTCPNRDGSLGTRGCIFCSEGGSGDFAQSPELSITAQIEKGKELLQKKQTSQKYIAYFQAFTNTYAPIDYLREIFTEAILHPDIALLSIATRPDCLPDSVVSLLTELNQIKPVWIELGLQTMHEATAKRIRRGYSLPCFEEAIIKCQKAHIPIIVHTILGLPGETKEEVIATMDYLSLLGIDGIKLQLLHVLKHTDLENYYKETGFSTLSLEEYVDMVISCLERLNPNIVIHRITGDAPKALLVSPLWSSHKKMVLNTIAHRLKQQDTWQGRYYTGPKERLRTDN